MQPFNSKHCKFVGVESPGKVCENNKLLIKLCYAYFFIDVNLILIILKEQLQFCLRCMVLEDTEIATFVFLILAYLLMTRC